MSSSTIWTMDEANMYCGADPNDENASLHLKLTEVKIPGIDEQFVDHRAAGAPVAIEINTIIARFECTFQLIGLDNEVYSLVAPIRDLQTWFYIYGLIKDRQAGTLQQASAVMRGRLARVDPQVYRRNDTLHTNFAIRGITYFAFSTAKDKIIWQWDFYNNFLQIGNQVVTAETNTTLHIPPRVAQGPTTSNRAANIQGGIGVA